MKALVVIDMQNDFVDGSLGTEEAQAIVPNVVTRVEEARQSDELLIFTRDTHHINYLDTFEGTHLPVEHCIRGMQGWEIIDELNEVAHKAHTIIDKPTFGSLVLADLLKEGVETREITEVELIGLCTDICVISNALLLRAYYPSLKLSVRENCCAGVTPELHKQALGVMKSCQIDVL